MRTRGQALLAAALTGVLAAGPVTAAHADEHRPPPTRAQVEKAEARASDKAAEVAAIQAELTVAQTRLEEAAHRAEVAAEAWNGARWRLREARRATAAATAEVERTRERIEAERAGIAQLVTQSYQDGTALNSVNALLSAEGPVGLMGRIGVVESVGESMEARYDEFRALNAMARVAEHDAVAAEAEQAKLAREAARLRDEAAQAANVAQSEAARIAGERRTLLAQLAKAQDITVELAARRQESLEEAAQQKAAAAAAAEAKEKAKKARAETEKARDKVEKTRDEVEDLGEEGGWDDPGMPVPAGTTEGAAKAIRFARAQLGEPYLWGAAGPDSWDCSGLTMKAWAQGGVSLPHYSAAQYSQSRHLTVGQLRPGDLVFWGTSPNTIHHVALYLGSGQILHAPRTGQPVQVNSMYYWVPPTYFGRP